MKKMTLLLRISILIISIISIIRLKQLLMMITMIDNTTMIYYDKLNEELLFPNNNNTNNIIMNNNNITDNIIMNNNNIIMDNNNITTTTSIISKQQHQQQEQEKSSSSLTSIIMNNNNNNNLIRKGISSCYKTRLRMVYPLYGNNGCINENGLAENNILGNSKERVYCRFYQYKIQLNDIQFFNYGGELMNDVLGQDENVEYIQYKSSNTFIINEIPNQKSSLLQQQINDAQNSNVHYIKDVLSHTMIIQQNVTVSEEENNNEENNNEHNNNYNEPKCTQYISGTTYLIQRYEYVNLFHTMTDWWNTWLAIDSIEAEQYDSQQKQSNNDISNDDHKKQIIFLDSHPNGILDDVWNTLFHNYTYIGQYIENKTTNNDVICFDDAVLVPAGYSSEFAFGWYDDSICKDYITTERFVNYVLDHFNIYDSHPTNEYHFIYIDRRPYISHPRAKIEKFERIISNLEQVAITVQQYVNSTFNVSSTYEIIQLDQYNMMEQITIIRKANILFGYHGAGLTHLLFLHYNAGIIEIQHDSGGDLFVNMAKWKKKMINITLLNGAIIQYEDTLHYQLIPSLYSSHMTDQYIQSHLLPAFQRIIIKQQQQQQKRNIVSS